MGGQWQRPCAVERRCEMDERPFNKLHADHGGEEVRAHHASITHHRRGKRNISKHACSFLRCYYVILILPAKLDLKRRKPDIHIYSKRFETEGNRRVVSYFEIVSFFWATFNNIEPSSTDASTITTSHMATTMAASSTSALDATQGRMPSSDRPEHVHYDALERHVLRSVEEKREFLFDQDKFDGELRRLEEDFEVPYEV